MKYYLIYTLSLVFLTAFLLSCKVNKYIEKNACLANLQNIVLVVDKNPLIKDRVINDFTDLLQEKLTDCNSRVVYKPMLDYEIKKERLHFPDSISDEQVMNRGLSIPYLLKAELLDEKTGMLLHSTTNLEEAQNLSNQAQSEHQVLIAFSLIDLNTEIPVYRFHIKSRSLPLAMPSNSNESSEMNYYLNLSSFQGTLQGCFKKAAKKIEQNCTCKE